MLFFMFLSSIPIMVISVSSKKLNGHQPFESMSLLGALISLRNNTFHNRNNYEWIIIFYLRSHLLLPFNFTIIHLNS